ncbi:hypothetical protein NOS3756_45490 [Nostoc sp. NIES-3756]|nr:hypothetical protein NOS3756_45490 [Nostoc sp. NIES-3756]BAY36679.1 hypothetical protein NIES2111_10100 [Nostoc sp. NIES-2111]
MNFQMLFAYFYYKSQRLFIDMLEDRKKLTMVEKLRIFLP